MGPSGSDGAPGPTGTQGPAGPIDPTAPAQPAALYLTPRPGAQSLSTLHWSLPAGGVAINYFIVYSSLSAIAGNTAAASQEAVAAGSHTDVVTLEANSGVQHFAVSAVSYTGTEGPLSAELVVDTTSRLAVRSTIKAAGAGIEQLQVISAGSPTSLATAPALQCTAGTSGCTAGQFTTGQGVDAIAWSPLGTQLAYIAHLSVGKPELWMVAADGQSAAFNVSGSVAAGNIVTNGGVKGPPGSPLPAWAPNGSGIVFLGDLAVHNVVELWWAPNTPVTAPLPSPQPTRLNTSFGSDTTKSVSAFEWSPDGSTVAFLSDQENDPGAELFVVPAHGGANTKLSGAMPDTTRNVTFFAWSPDGTRLAFVADRDTAGLPELYVVGAAGGGLTKVSGALVNGSTGVIDTLNGLSPFRWAPGGERIAFLATKDDAATTELYVVSATGGATTKLSGVIPAGDAVSEFAWSPDGSQVGFLVNDLPNTGVNFDVFLASAGGGGIIASGKGNTTNDVDTLRFSLSGHLSVRWDRGGGVYDLIGGDTSALQGLIELVTPAAPFLNVNYTVTAGRTPPTWSPDGSRIAFLADASSGNAFGLFVTLPAGQLLRLVDAPAGRSVDNYAWSPLGWR